MNFNLKEKNPKIIEIMKNLKNYNKQELMEIRRYLNELINIKSK